MNELSSRIATTARSLVRSRGYAATVIATLAIGIGASTSIFSILHGTVLQPLPFPHAEDSPEMRAGAVQWLPRSHPGTGELVNALVTIAFEDPAEQVRLEAVDAIANLDSEEARPALVTIVETHPELKHGRRPRHWLGGAGKLCASERRNV